MPQIARRASFVLLLVLSLVALAPAGASAAAGPAIAASRCRSGVCRWSPRASREGPQCQFAAVACDEAARLPVARPQARRARRGAGRHAPGTELKARAQRTVNVTLTVPSAAKEGRYRVIVCAGTRCVVSSAAVRVTRRAASPAPAAPAAPPPLPPPPRIRRPSLGPRRRRRPSPRRSSRPSPSPSIPTCRPTSPTRSSFLYSGANRVQTGVAPGTIKTDAASPSCAAASRTATGSGLGGVAITVLDHPELGRTITRADGGYDLAVNGGGPLTLDVRARRLRHRAAPGRSRPWQDFAAIEDVVMVAYDAKVTRVDLDGRRRPGRRRHAGHRRRRHPPGQRAVPRRHEGGDGAARRRRPSR